MKTRLMRNMFAGLALAAALAGCTGGESNLARYESLCLNAGHPTGSPAFGACVDRLQRDAAYWARLQSSGGFGGP